MNYKKSAAEAACLILLSFTSLNAVAQQQDAVDELRAPTIPAFELLSSAPKSVERPTTPSELATDLSGLTSGAGIKNSYGVESTPYNWFGGATRLQDYLRPYEDLYSAPADMWRTLALSVGTGQSGYPKDSTGTALSFGIRTELLSGHVAASLDSNMRIIMIRHILPGLIIGSLRQKLEQRPNSESLFTCDAVLKMVTLAVSNLIAINDTSPIPRMIQNDSKFTPKEIIGAGSIITDILRKKLKACDTCSHLKPEPCDSCVSLLVNCWVSYLDAQNDSLLNDAEIKKCIQAIRDTSKERIGFLCELAFANKNDLLVNEVSNSKFEKSAFWITIGNSWENGFNFFLSARYTHNASWLDSADYFDGGLSLGFHNKSLSVSAEGLLRSKLQVTKSNTANGGITGNFKFSATNKYDVNVTYSLSSAIAIGFTIGKDYAVETPTGGPLIALLGANYNLSKIAELINKL